MICSIAMCYTYLAFQYRRFNNRKCIDFQLRFHENPRSKPIGGNGETRITKLGGKMLQTLLVVFRLKPWANYSTQCRPDLFYALLCSIRLTWCHLPEAAKRGVQNVWSLAILGYSFGRKRAAGLIFCLRLISVL